MEQTLCQCSIHYTISKNKESSQTPILFLHGWGCDETIFTSLQSDMASKTTTITVDFPGHGKSGQPPIPWGVEQFGEQIFALLKDQHIFKVDIVAHSFGGRIAIYLASHYPELINKMIITGGAGIKKPLSKSQRKRQAHFKRMNKWLNVGKKIPFMTNTIENYQQALRNKYGSADYRKLNEVMRKTFVTVISEDLTPYLSQISAPTLLIWGEVDTETPLWMAQSMESTMQDAALIVFEGRTHFAFVEESQRFSVIANEFFFGGET